MASGKAWKAEEVVHLKELDAIYKDYKFPNIELSKILITKTADQIKSKRKMLRTIEIEGDLQEEASATEGRCDLVEPFMAPGSQENVVNNDEMVREWQQCLVNEIEKPVEVPPILREVYTRLSRIWDERKNYMEALKACLDEFLTEHL